MEAVDGAAGPEVQQSDSRFDLGSSYHAGILEKRTVVATECSEAPGMLLLEGDSFSYKVLPFFAESFGRVVYLGANPDTSELDAFAQLERPTAAG
jgi:hypothetical protein